MTEKHKTKTPKCGYVAIIGRPNVGKSTLLNRIIGQKLSITSRKPQTTRHTLLGIKTEGNAQAIYVDTPGLHGGGRQAINRYMNRAASSVLKDVDVVVVVVDGFQWRDDDELVLKRVGDLSVPVILVVNKVDQIKSKEHLLPWLHELDQKMSFACIVPISALRGTHVEELETAILGHLPDNPFLFEEDQMTDRNERFFAAEIIREKLTRLLGQELPYALTVEIESFSDEQSLLRIGALVWVERDGQKAIVIGKKGEKLKEVGEKARRDMERLFGRKVFLQLWVRVKKGWTDDQEALSRFGYGD